LLRLKVTLLNSKLLKDGILYKFLKYSISTAFYQAKENENAFLNSFRSYGLTQQQLEMNSEKQWKLVKFNKMSDDKLNQLATTYSHIILGHLENSRIPFVYDIIAILQRIA
jgi:hypothetical protein